MKNVQNYPTVEDAVNSIPPNEPAALYFPSGIYRLTAPLSFADRSVLIRGDSIGATELRFASGVLHGIQINNSSSGANSFPVEISNLSLTTDNGIAGTAVEISYQNNFDYRWVSRGLLSNLEIRGSTNTSGWQYGLACSEGVNVSVAHVSFLGKHDQSNLAPSANTQSEAAIKWGGNSTPCELKVYDIVVTAWKTGIEVADKSEGVYVNQATFLLCNTGIHWAIAQPAYRWRPLLAISDSHFNVYARAVDLSYVIESMIHNNLIYLNDKGANGVAILADGCGIISVHHNVFHSFQQSCNGVILTGGSQYCDVSSNIFNAARRTGSAFPDNFDTGIWIQPGCIENLINDNLFYEQCRFTEIYDQGQGNLIRNADPKVRIFR